MEAKIPEMHFNAAFIPKAWMADAFGQVFRLVPGYPLPSHPPVGGQ
jgi:hypothetical protein